MRYILMTGIAFSLLSGCQFSSDLKIKSVPSYECKAALQEPIDQNYCYEWVTIKEGDNPEDYIFPEGWQDEEE